MKIFLLGAAACVLTVGASVAQADPQSAKAAKPTYGSYGFDTKGMDPSVKPGDDFYLHANGGWARATPIPPDKSNYGAFNVLDDLSRERTRGILEAARADHSSKIGLAYASYLDAATVEKKGLAPIKPWIAKIKGIRNRADYAQVAAQAARMGVSGPFAFYVGQDDKDPESYILNMRQSGLGLPDRDFYLQSDDKMAAIRTAYVAHLEQMLTLAGENESSRRRVDGVRNSIGQGPLDAGRQPRR